MIDWQAEELIKLAQVAKKIPGRPAVSTVWRWAIQGCRGVRLETLMIGATRYTSNEAVQRFFAEITRRSNAGGEIPGRQHRKSDTAHEECERLGI